MRWISRGVALAMILEIIPIPVQAGRGTTFVHAMQGMPLVGL
ncbi:MAG: hypothetical protein ACREL9_11160 [Gemmatimonadales bacterium]